MLVRLYEIGQVSFCLLRTNGFQRKAENERFSAVGSRCRQNLTYENFTSSFGRLRQKIPSKRMLQVQHDYFSSFNQSNHRFMALPSFLKLPSDDDDDNHEHTVLTMTLMILIFNNDVK